MVALMRCFLVFMLVVSAVATGQASVRYTPVERAWLELLSRPVPGTASVYFHVVHRFGVDDIPFNRVIALKSGPDCWFLLDGTERVYRLLRGEGGPYLQRVDSTVHDGGHNMVTAFMRRDTVFRLGGYGFWRTRDHFTWFDERTGRWQRLASASNLPSTLSIHQYDDKADALYLAGARRHLPHEHFRDELWDSLYRFDFGRRRWSNLGRLSEVEIFRAIIADPVINTTVTRFGVFRFSDQHTRLADLAGGRLMRLREGDARVLRPFYESRKQEHEHPRNWVHLGDSLFMVSWTERSARLVGIPFGRDLFEDTVGASLRLVERARSPSARSWSSVLADGLMVLAGLVLAGVLFAATGPGRLLRLRFRTLPPGVADVEGLLADFLEQLKPAERVLLANLLREARAGRSVGTDAVSHWLGMARRGPELQKIARNRAWQQINSSFRLLLRVEGDLVERVRDLHDRRLVTYRVSEVWADRLAAALEKRGEGG
jgi:hypothetical protein